MTMAAGGLEAAYAKVLARKERLEKRVAALAVPEKPHWWNRSYPVTIKLPLTVNVPVVGTVTIDDGHNFYVTSYEAAYEVTGILAEDGETPATVPVPEPLRPLFFDYQWTIRDSVNREWQSLPRPSAEFRSGNVQGMEAVSAQTCLRSGTTVEVRIVPIDFTTANAGLIGLDSIGSHMLTVALFGVAVREGFHP